MLQGQAITADGMPTHDMLELWQRLLNDIDVLFAGGGAVDIAQAEAVVLSTYGDTVSVAAKGKNLNKFGLTASGQVTTSWTTVQQFQGSEKNETFVSTNLIDSISSSDAADTGKTYTIEGHTVDGSGNLTFVVQDVTTDGSDGRNKVALGTPLARATRLYLKQSGTFNSPQTPAAGVIYVYDDTAGESAGVPSSAAATKILLPAGEVQSEKAATAISATDYWFISYFYAGVGNAGGSASYVQVRMETRDVANGGVWRPMGQDVVLVVDATPSTPPPFRPFLIVPKNHDWRVRAKTDSNTAEVFAEAGGYLAAVQ